MNKLALLDSIETRPNASFLGADGGAWLQDFSESCKRLENEGLQAFETSPQGEAFLRFLGQHSPHLSRIILSHLPYFASMVREGIAPLAERFWAENQTPPEGFASQDALMRHLRQTKAKGALLAAIADLTHVWNVERVTRFLSDLAEHCLHQAVDYLLGDAIRRGELEGLDPAAPSRHSGWIILGMGKLGAYELNYSSDIDLIVLFDPEKLSYTGKQTLQHCFNRMTRDLVGIMQERTHDGYVFRTDIRLRPDPASTPPALSVAAAMSYYERVGQNWERAAMIKARPVAGDTDAAERFLTGLSPFIWRRYLDFASIADIHSIKRQIDHKIGRSESLLGHNLKLGAGGIREIEFFVQVQQLIWGGRKPQLRKRATCDMLHALVTENIIEGATACELEETYRLLRTLEHRLQMQRDQQTHSLPLTEPEFEAFAHFAGYENAAALEKELRFHLKRVGNHTTQLYGKEESLGSHGNLVFTGVEPDPETVANLQRMGFEQAATVCERIMNWHRGHRRAVRNKRARELLTEITPTLLEELAATAHPDAALLKFDEFLDKLPGGVQIFSLFSAKPELLRLIATLMGSAPRLAEILSRNPHLLDGTLTGAFYAKLPDKQQMQTILQSLISVRGKHEDFINTLGQFKNEYEFQAGIQLMSGMTRYADVARFLSLLAELLLEATLRHVMVEFEAGYGQLQGAEIVLLAMGKLGSRELTFSSDLDLIFVYHTPDNETPSSGTKPLSPSVYYNRLFQRFLGMLTSLNREGRLYEVDTRLRPLGAEGPLAASLEAYDKYFTETAWTFERMAITRARVAVGHGALGENLEAVLYKHLTTSYDAPTILNDAYAMREKVFAEHKTQNPWEVKHVRGGMMDIDFIVQALQLIHAHAHPEILNTSTQDVLLALGKSGVLQAADATALYQAYGLQSHILHLLRLTSHGTLEEETAPQGLKNLLTKQLGFEDFALLQSTLIKTEKWVYSFYQTIMNAPASEGEKQ